MTSLNEISLIMGLKSLGDRGWEGWMVEGIPDSPTSVQPAEVLCRFPVLKTVASFTSLHEADLH